ncbi:hypothetical protein [Streptomyces sp. NPDC057682]|uniref:hypothetical protein n=1 Tax=Streptomyces sp. NPDC057682 TaxID=3346210 RepID=UPI00368E75D4
MSAPTPTGHQPDDRGLQPPAFGQPSPALIARADRGYARFLATPAAAPGPVHEPEAGGHGQDHDAAGPR